MVTPLSGTYAGIGQQVRWGLDLAVKEVNAAGGIMGRPIELLYEDEEANPAVAVQKAEKLFEVAKVDFLTGTVSSGSTLAVGQLAERAGKLIATTVSFADSITGDRCSPNVFRVNARAGQQSAALAVWLSKEKPQAKVFYLGPDYEMGRSTVAAFKASAEKVGASTVGEVFAPLDAKDYTQYFGQVRAARPQVLYTSVAGNDTVRLLSQMQEFGLLNNLSLVGASGTVTSQNISAIGKAAEGFVTGVGYSTEIASPENKKFVDAFKAAYKAEPDLYGADSYGLIYAYKAAVEKAKSTETDKVREALRGLKWMTPQGEKTIRAGDHQAVQTMYVVRITNGQFKIGRRASRATSADRAPDSLHAVLSLASVAADDRGQPLHSRSHMRAAVMTEVLDYIEFVLAPQVVTGLAFGVAVILVAIGLTIIFGLLDVINMSHGEFYAFGAFGALALGWLGVPFWLLLVLVPLAMLPVGYAVERVLIQRVFNRPDRHVTTLLLTFGLGMVLEDAFRLGFGPNPYRPETPIPGAVELFGIFLPNYRLFLIVVGAIVIAAVALVVYRTRLGAMVRAAAFDRNMAASLGVPVAWVYAGAFAFGISLAGFAGVLLAPIYSVFPTMGRDFILMAFTVVIVGGMGSIAGAVVAGPVPHPGAGDRRALHLAGVDRSDRVRDHGGDADGAPARSVRAARTCLTR